MLRILVMKTSKKTSKKNSVNLSIKNVAIIYRPHKPEALSITRELVTWLKGHGLRAYCLSSQKINGSTQLKSQADIAKMDLFIVIGGDGTYLKAARIINGRPIPILGFNLGALGFMTELSANEIFKAVEQAITGKLKLQSRTMLSVTLKKKGKKPNTLLALNDIVIERGPVSRLINLGIYSNEHLITELKADGLIICSPTGSTAYNLAASGPIVHPDVRAMMVTPICPHSLTNRPITLPDQHTITIKVTQSTHKAVFMVDGHKQADIRDHDEVIINKSESLHYRLVKPQTNYFDILRKKLNFGQRD